MLDDTQQPVAIASMSAMIGVGDGGRGVLA